MNRSTTREWRIEAGAQAGGGRLLRMICRREVTSADTIGRAIPLTRLCRDYR
ncbi:MAG: hypothetical protein LBD28_05595 [Tannerellaceae bacterium]|nr:hypothetical protein [Tannerellaceae bacterium]